MQTVYIGNTLVNDVMLGSQRMDDVFTPKSPFQIEYLIVGGGGGSRGQSAGGGAGGGLLSGSTFLQSNFTYKVQVGGGGTWSATPSTSKGQNSYLTGSNLYFIAEGGGYGGALEAVGGDGGNGGGAGFNINNATYYAGGTGSLGYNGGAGVRVNNSGSGGGAGAGQPGNLNVWGKGGDGLQSAIDGTLKYYAGGGGGQRYSAGTGVAGGLGGGASGSSDSADGTNNLGGGAGGGQSGPVGGANDGGNGIVIIRYLAPQRATGGVVTTDGSYIIHSFTSSLQVTSANFDLQTLG
jgi:hypothetical protein